MSINLPIVFADDDGILRTTSENIADFTGQTHTRVRAEIKIAIELGAFFGTNDIRSTSNGGYELTRDGASLIVPRLPGAQAIEWHTQYIKTFNRMAEALCFREKKNHPTVPYHLARYLANKDNVPAGHFSVLTETTLLLMGCLESAGYQLPENMLPDGSVGHWFCEFLRGEGIDTKRFRRWFREDWLVNHAERYFEERDAVALAFLPSICRTSIPKPYSRGPCESYIERSLLTAVQQIDPKIEVMTQAQIGKYRADFLFLPNLIVECDGHIWHERTPEQASSDKSRDRWMHQNGFFVFRFTGSEITHILPKCVGQIFDFIKNTRLSKHIQAPQISTFSP